MFKRIALILPMLLLAFSAPASAAAPAVRILQETGQTRSGYPVFQYHRNEEELARTLTRGFGERFFRLYHAVMVYREKHLGKPVEPAYFLYKPGSGGFGRTGFYLGERNLRQQAYAEAGLGNLTGRFGAVDQIALHELTHALQYQILNGPPEAGAPTFPHDHQMATQTHAIGVRSGPTEALKEGMAELMQAMVIEDPGAAPDTHALAGDQASRTKTDRAVEAYRAALTRPFGYATLARAGLGSWYVEGEQALRYYGIKENLFARTPTPPDRLLAKRNLYGAYLLQSIIPGRPDDPPRTAAQMLSIEGTVGSLLYRWVHSPQLQQAYQDDGFYREFGMERSQVDGLDNAFLKLFYTMIVTQADTAAELVNGYQQLFPGEAEALEQVVRESMLGQSIPDATEIWLANPRFAVALIPYDQFRRLPVLHAFDLNAASLTDLMGVKGVDRPLAEAILKGQPFATVNDLERVPGMTEPVLQRFASMALTDEQLWSRMIHSFLSATLWFLIPAWAAGFVLYWLIARKAWWKALLTTLVIPLFALIPGAALATVSPVLLKGVVALELLLPFAPVLLFGLPAFLWRLRPSRRNRNEAWRVLGAWSAASMASFLLLTIRF